MQILVGMKPHRTDIRFRVELGDRMSRILVEDGVHSMSNQNIRVDPRFLDL